MWGAWSSCTSSCGGGQQWRLRQCEGRAYGGKDCKGHAADTQSCNVEICPGKVFLVLKSVNIMCFIAKIAYHIDIYMKKSAHIR